MYMGFRATLNFRKLKVALNPMYRIFKTLPKVASFFPTSDKGGGHRGLLETEKPRKKSLKTAKLQEISSETENRIKVLTQGWFSLATESES